MDEDDWDARHYENAYDDDDDDYEHDDEDEDDYLDDDDDEIEAWISKHSDKDEY